MQYKILNPTLTFSACEKILAEIAEPLTNEQFKEEVFYWKTAENQAWLYDGRKLIVWRAVAHSEHSSLFYKDAARTLSALLGEATSYWHKHAARYVMPNDLTVSFVRYCNDRQNRLFVEIDGARLSDRKYLAKELQLVLDLAPLSDGPEKLFARKI